MIAIAETKLNKEDPLDGLFHTGIICENEWICQGYQYSHLIIHACPYKWD
jgi:hypothetical protein